MKRQIRNRTLALALTLALLLGLLPTAALAQEQEGFQYTVSGTVLDADGQPVGGATVKAGRFSEVVAETTTDDQGDFTITLPSGLATLTAAKAGDDPEQVAAQTVTGHTKPLTGVTLQQGVAAKTELRDIEIDNKEGLAQGLRTETGIGLWVRCTGLLASQEDSFQDASTYWSLTGGESPATGMMTEDGIKLSQYTKVRDGAVIFISKDDTASSVTLTVVFKHLLTPLTDSVDIPILGSTPPPDYPRFSQTVNGITWYMENNQGWKLVGAEPAEDFAGAASMPSVLTDAETGANVNVTNIAPGSLSGLDWLHSLTLPSSLGEVGAAAMANCENLSQVTFENPDAQIGAGALLNCPGLTIIARPGGSVEAYARANGIRFQRVAQEWEYYSFANAASDFFLPGEKQNYPLCAFDTPVRLGCMVARYGPQGRSLYISLTDYAQNTLWGGSCYGIAVTEGLYNEGYARLGLSSLPGARDPKDDDLLRGAINHYFLLQMLSDMRTQQHWGCYTDTQYVYYTQRVDWRDELEGLVEAVKSGPGLFCYQFISGGAMCGHAIILESVKSEENGVYTLVARDNRFPGENGGGETEVVVDLSGNDGKGSLTLHYPSPYRGSEEAIEFEFDQDFEKFQRAFPLVRGDGNQVEPEEGMHDYRSTLAVAASGNWSLQAGGGTMENTDGQLPLGDGGGVTLGALMTSSAIAEGEVVNTPSTVVYEVAGGDVAFTPDAGQDGFYVSYAGTDGFASISAEGAASATLTAGGQVSAQDVSGTATLAIAAGDGTLIRLSAAASGAETDDFTLAPTANGASITAPAGSYAVTMEKTDGTRHTQTVQAPAGGGAVSVTVPQDDPNPPSGGGSGRDDKPSGGSKVTIPPPGTDTGKVGLGSLSLKADAKGALTLSAQQIKTALSAARRDAKEKSVDGLLVQVSVELTSDGMAVTLPAAGLDALIDAGASLAIGSGVAALKLDSAALSALLDQAGGGDVTLSVQPAKLEAAAVQALSGSRPALDFSVRAGEKTVGVAFGPGHVTAGIPYAPAAGEAEDRLYCAYVDGTSVTALEGSRYDAGEGRVLFAPEHFSVYAVGLALDAPAFTDIAGHWAEEDIQFVASRGLLNGTGGGAFSPDASMTRAMFVTALYRLAGEPAQTGDAAFHDVPEGAYYSDAVRWASSRGVVRGTGGGAFTPDRAVTRQEMAVIMENYAKARGETLPQIREAADFADESAIAGWAAEAVDAMQRSGVLSGKDGGRFDPAGTATRGEVAAVLRRFVELPRP